MDGNTPKSLTDVLICMRELLRQIDAGEITADDRQRNYFQDASKPLGSTPVGGWSGRRVRE